MKNINKYKTKIVTAVIIVIALTAAYFAGDTDSGKHQQPELNNDSQIIFVEQESQTSNEKQQTSPQIEEPQQLPNSADVKKNTANTCTLTINCDTILNNMSLLASEKQDIIPKDGVVLPETEIQLSGGETVFDVLKQQLKQEGIHFEFVQVPMYNSVYIEGIANIYEYDCGELSGWMYKVNGYYPNYGSSHYKVNPSDVIEVVYTCDLGTDVGGAYSARNGM